MVNYGYNKGTEGWKEDKKITLAFKLSKRLSIPIGYVAGFHNLYIEVDGTYGGVRIRHMSHLTEEQDKELTEKSDKIYEEVMSIK